jgi:hypothetical protein
MGHVVFSINIEYGTKTLSGKIEMHRSQSLINFAWSLTTEHPMLRDRYLLQAYSL